MTDAQNEDLRLSASILDKLLRKAADEGYLAPERFSIEADWVDLTDVETAWITARRNALREQLEREWAERQAHKT